MCKPLKYESSLNIVTFTSSTCLLKQLPIFKAIFADCTYWFCAVFFYVLDIVGTLQIIL